MTQTYFYTTIKALFDDQKYLISKLDDKFNKSVNKIIADQDEKVDNKIEKKIQPLSLNIKYISSKQGEQAKLFSSFTENYDESLEKTSINKKTSTKF